MYLKNLTTPSAPTRTFLLCIKSARQYLYPAPAAPNATRAPVRRSHDRPLRLRGALEVSAQSLRLATGDREHTRTTSCIDIRRGNALSSYGNAYRTIVR